jgi:hypothetical protein
MFLICFSSCKEKQICSLFPILVLYRAISLWPLPKLFLKKFIINASSSVGYNALASLSCFHHLSHITQRPQHRDKVNPHRTMIPLTLWQRSQHPQTKFKTQKTLIPTTLWQRSQHPQTKSKTYKTLIPTTPWQCSQHPQTKSKPHEDHKIVYYYPTPPRSHPT